MKSPLEFVIHEETRSKLQLWKAKRSEDENLLLATITDGVTLQTVADKLKKHPSTVLRQRTKFLEFARRDLADLAP